jgi:hypothetical protein
VPVFFVIAILVVAFWVWKRKRAAAAAPPHENAEQPAEKAQLHSDSVDNTKWKSQLHSESLNKPVHELQGDLGSSHELPAVEPVASELELTKKSSIPRKPISTPTSPRSVATRGTVESGSA